MSALCFVIALISFAVKCFNGRIGNLDLIAFGLIFMAAGHLLGGGAITWIKQRVAD